MLSVSQALQNAANTASWAAGMCDNFVAKMYGFQNSGYDSASVHWASLPAQDKHPGDMNAPAGALMFWGGGYGHVAISDGQGGIYSTDIPSAGNVGHVQASYVSRVWGKPYLGWSTPYFQGQSDNVGPTSPVQQTLDLNPLDIPNEIAQGVGSGMSQAITSGIAGFGSSFIKWGIWGGEFLFGIVLIGFGIVLLVKGTRLAPHV
jgi:hypothetical protein